MSFEFFTYRRAGVPLVQPVAIAGFFEEDVPSFDLLEELEAPAALVQVRNAEHMAVARGLD